MYKTVEYPSSFVYYPSTKQNDHFPSPSMDTSPSPSMDTSVPVPARITLGRFTTMHFVHNQVYFVYKNLKYMFVLQNQPFKCTVNVFSSFSHSFLKTVFEPLFFFYIKIKTLFYNGLNLWFFFFFFTFHLCLTVSSFIRHASLCHFVF